MNFPKSQAQKGPSLQDAFSDGMDIFIRGDLVDLVTLNEEAACESPWASWFNDEEATMYMQQHHFPITRAMQAEFFRDEVSGNASKIQLGIRSTHSKTFIGVISLSRIDWISRRAELAIMIGDRKFRTLNFWHEANTLMISHAFQNLNLNRIVGGSIRKEVADLYVKLLNFHHEGVFRQHAFKNGTYADCYMFGRLVSD